MEQVNFSMLIPKIGKNSENWLTNPSLIHIVLALAVSRPLKKSKHSCANCSFTTPISRQEWEPKEKSLKLTKPVVTYDSQYKSWNSAIFFTILNCCMHEYLSFLQKLCTENCLRFLCCENMNVMTTIPVLKRLMKLIGHSQNGKRTFNWILRTTC